MSMEPARLAARVTLLVAAAGYGKTTWVRRLLAGSPVAWLPAWPLTWPEPADWLVLDTASEAGPDAAPGAGPDTVPDRVAELTDGIRRLPDGRRVIVISRCPLPSAPARLAGVLSEIGPADLALTPAEVARTLVADHQVTGADLADEVHAVTAGWPALVHLAGERLRVTGAGALRGTELMALLAGPDSAIAAFLTDEVLAGLDPAQRRMTCRLAHLGTVDEQLCQALTPGRGPSPLVALARTGLTVPVLSGPVGAVGPRDTTRTGPAQRLVPLVAHVVRQHWPLAPVAVRRLHHTVAVWCADQDRPGEAVQAHLAAGDQAAAAELLRTVGPDWVRAGGAPTIVAIVAALPAELTCRRLRTLLGEALMIVGRDEDALDVLGGLAEAIGAAEDGNVTGDGNAEADESAAAPSLPVGIAWRLGAVRYLRGDAHGATAAFARARLDGRCPADEAFLHSWAASVRWSVGDVDAVAAVADRARLAAELAGSPGAKAAAQVALALHAMLRGDRAANAAHYEVALRFADEAGDRVQAARIRANRASHLLEEARYGDAAVEARAAVNLAEETGYAAVHTVALCNEGEALTRLGELDAAARCYEQALEVFRHQGARAYALTGIGNIHRLGGRYELARAAFEEAARVAGDSGDLQGLVPALAGLTRVTATADPAAAAVAAERADRAATGPFRTLALLARGWVAAGAGRRAQAATFAVEAAEVARQHRDRAGLAEALELRAAVATDPVQARQAWREAAETWRVTGARLDLDRVTVTMAYLPGADSTERIEARLAQERLDEAGVRHGCRVPGADATGPADRPDTRSGGAPVPVAVRALGRFEVMLGGVAVPVPVWQSRKSRDLLRILVARRGRPTSRDELMQLLWGDVDPDRLAHRLSVALSTLRQVLDPDRRVPVDHFVLANQAAVALDTDRLEVDVETFLAEAEHGLRLWQRGAPGDARLVLVGAERRYTGDFLEGEPYEDWSVAAREEARATYLRVVRALAELNQAAGRTDDVVLYLLKLLGKDPYDERAHHDLTRTLTAAGHHGEARRARARYEAAMREIGIVPVPGALAPAGPAGTARLSR